MVAPCAATCPLRYFYASSACIYPEFKQLDTTVEGGGLKEADAWPAQVRAWGAGWGGVDAITWRGVLGLKDGRGSAGMAHVMCPAHAPLQPQDAYGLEKLASEEIAKHYCLDFGIECRIARFHNIYGPHGTWKGGREKAPAAFCRKVRRSTRSLDAAVGDEQQQQRARMPARRPPVRTGGATGMVRHTRPPVTHPVGHDEARRS